jgi:hypothetical protein
MPRYFFHIRNGGDLIEDSDGLELTDPATARDECSKAMKEILLENEWQALMGECQFEIVDELGRTIAVLPFRP